VKTPEGKVKDNVKALLTEHGAYQFWPVQTGYGRRTLDALCCHHGHFFAIETKRDGEDLTPFQKNTRAEMLHAGAKVFRVSRDAELASLAHALELMALNPVAKISGYMR
jgi:hypothetical protein